MGENSVSLTAYQIFCTIAEQKNMTKAAELLHITPSAVTHSMNALEKSLGFALLNRDRGGATLTAHGEMLLPRFRAILLEEQRLQEEAAQINGLEKGCVRIGALNSVCIQWLPEILTSFHSKYPNIEVRVYQGGYQEIEDMVEDSRLDLGFVSMPTSERFDTITLFHDRLFCVVPQGFAPQEPPYVRAEDLRDLPLILAKRGYDRNIQEFIEENKLTVSEQHDIALESAVIALVESGMGYSILPEMTLEHQPGSYQTFPLIHNKYRTIGLAVSKDKKPSLATQKMIQEIRDKIEDRSMCR